jgi:hypothetical protein
MRIKPATMLKLHFFSAYLFFSNIIFSILYWFFYDYLGVVETMVGYISKCIPTVFDFFMYSPIIRHMVQYLTESNKFSDIPFFQNLFIVNYFLLTLSVMFCLSVNLLDREKVIVNFAQEAASAIDLIKALLILSVTIGLSFMLYTGIFIVPSLSPLPVLKGRALALIVGCGFSSVGFLYLTSGLFARVMITTRIREAGR